MPKVKAYALGQGLGLKSRLRSQVKCYASSQDLCLKSRVMSEVKGFVLGLLLQISGYILYLEELKHHTVTIWEKKQIRAVIMHICHE